jgi:diacylglycerol kinase (ATP)
MSNEPRKFSWKARFKSFVYAGNGIIQFFRTEHNAQIHLAVAILVIVFCIFLPVSKNEVFAIIFSIAFVWVTEMINTAIEKAMDFISMEKHPAIKHVKDMAAGAVLIATIAAVIVGCVIFIPKIL